MALFKAIATITWSFDADQPIGEALGIARNQLEKIVDCHPFGQEYENFRVQMDIAQMKDRKRLIHINCYSVDEIMSYITTDDSKRDFEVDGKKYSVRMNSDRYFVFQQSRVCVSCGLEGTKMMLDINPGDNNPHFNLYGEEEGRLILMTKDHILAKSKGGLDELSNYQTMCSICNNLKGAYNLTLDGCRQLRNLYCNEQKMPRKELREMINKVRTDLSVA
jgi:hypothetical protein